jgi:NTE family protein
MQVKTILPLLLLALAVSVSGESVMDSIRIGGLRGLDPRDHRHTYPVLVALSGGGARGLASIGVLRAFQEKGIRVVAIAGTSMGGVVGGLYACGYTPAELEDITKRTDFSTLFSNAPPRSTMFVTQRQERDRHLLSIRFNGFRPVIPRGLLAGQRLTSLLASLTLEATYRADGDYDSLRIPFRTIATDVVSGRMVTFSDGSLSEAMRATMAFPLAFTGLERGNELLMDGGMVMPVPVEIVKRLCDSVHFVVGVNTTSPLMSKSDLTTPVDIADQVTTIMDADKLREQLSMADYVVTPAGDQYRSSDFDRKDSIITLGYRDGLVAADSIVAVIKSRTSGETLSLKDVAVICPDSDVSAKLEARLRQLRLSHESLVDTLKTLCMEFGLFELSAYPSRVANPSTSGDSSYTVPVRLELQALPAPMANRLRLIFSGNTIYPDDSLVRFMGLDDSLLTPWLLADALKRLVDKYHADKHDLANLRRVDVNLADSTISILIDEGIIRRIDILNNVRTRDWYIRSYFPLKVGQPYSKDRASRGIADLYGTELFDLVTQDVEPVDSGVDVKISVEEKAYTQVRLGWHWDDEYQSEEFIELLDDNIGGIGMEYQLHARYSPRRQQYFAGLRANRIFSTYLTGQIRAEYSRLNRHLFDPNGKQIGQRWEYRGGGFVRFGQQIARFGTVTGKLMLEQVQYRDQSRQVQEKFNLNTLSLESLVENLNRWPFPESGRRHYLEVQSAAHFLGGDVEYTKFFSSIESYFPLGGDVNYHARLTIGLSRRGLPVSEQFYMGGLHSFAGYHTDQLSGDKILLLNQELRLRLPLDMYLTGMYDAGEVYVSADQIKLRNLRHGYGFSLAYDSPIGPVELGYGAAGSNNHRVYFSAGLAF